TRDQVPVMIEPLIKLVRPIIYFLSPRNDALSRTYFLIVTLFTVLTWSFFGGAITRIAAVELARGGRIGAIQANRFAKNRLVSYVLAPIFPLLGIFVFWLLLVIYGLFAEIPMFGDILVSGVFWPIAVVFGLLMAGILVGMLGWPLMAATVSTEGTDSWE